MTVSQWLMTEMTSRVSCKWVVTVTSGLNTDKSWALILEDTKCEGLVELQTLAA